MTISYPFFSLFLHLSSIFSRTKHTYIQNMISLEQILLIANRHICNDETDFNLISTNSFQHFAYENTGETISNLGHHIPIYQFIKHNKMHQIWGKPNGKIKKKKKLQELQSLKFVGGAWYGFLKIFPNMLLSLDCQP
jgi:hypothetical protein